MVLHVDGEVQGFIKEITNVNDMRAAVVTLIDENVTEVSIKKRAVKGSSPKDEIDEAVERFITQ